jgi:cell division protease FtsH
MERGKDEQAERGSRSEPKASAPAPNPGRSLVLWLLLLSGLVAFNLFIHWPNPHPEVEIPYSVFRAQVRKGNVSRVLIVGDRITGSFVEAVQWPEAGAHTSTTQPAPTPSTTLPAATYTRFATAFPEAVGDPSLLPLLEHHEIRIEVHQPSSPWWVSLLVGWSPLLLLVLVFWWMGRQASRQQAGIFGFGRSRARRYANETPDVTFADVAGADEAKRELQEEVDFLRHPKKYHDLGARIPRGVLLVGPPGTGKTLLGRAVAGEAGAPFFNLSASEFVEMFVGVGASRVRDLFKQAKMAAPAIVFIDELDAVGRRRGAGVGAVNDEREQTLNQLLVEMDGFDSNEGVILIAATNRPDVLDPALLRPGRFDRQIVVDRPDARGRAGILKVHTRGKPLGDDVDLTILAKGTPGLAGADLANLVNEAALLAARKNRKKITMRDFEEAKDKVMMGAERKSLVMSEEEKKTTAYHESGHALVGWMIPEADPIHKVTVIPRGRALGVTHFLPEDDHYTRTKEYYLASMATMMGGRAAEQIIFGRITNGAANDIQTATTLARMMVCEWGMSERLGPLQFGKKEEMVFLGREISQQKDYSERTAEMIDEEVHSLVGGAYEKAEQILRQNLDKLHGLAQALLEREVLDRTEIARILNGEPLETLPEEPVSPDAASPAGTKDAPASKPVIQPRPDPLPGSASA